MGSTFFATEEHLLYNRLRDKTDSQWVHLYGVEPCEYMWPGVLHGGRAVTSDVFLSHEDRYWVNPRIKRRHRQSAGHCQRASSSHSSVTTTFTTQQSIEIWQWRGPWGLSSTSRTKISGLILTRSGLDFKHPWPWSSCNGLEVLGSLLSIWMRWTHTENVTVVWLE